MVVRARFVSLRSTRTYGGAAAPPYPYSVGRTCWSAVISPLNGVGPEDLRIAELEKRLKTEPVREVIIALGTDVEGDATSYYLAKRFASDRVQVTQLAQGLSAGSGLEYADEVTLSRALEGRRELR